MTKPMPATGIATSGRPKHLLPEQKQALDQFKQELQNAGLFKAGPPPSHDDATLLRFLRARKFDVAKSKLMFSEAEKWRQQFGVDQLYNNFDYKERAAVNQIYPQFYHKTDKDGRPVYIEQLGKLDLNKLYSVTTPERQLQRLVVEYEKFLRDRLPVCTAIRDDGELVDTSCTIMDLHGVGISQFWKVKNFVQEASSISQNYYPETMGKFYIINAPYLFSTAWSLIKGWLDPVTVAKIAIVDSHSVQAQLLAQIPAENLPSIFPGGKCNCAGGCSLSDAGPWQDAAVLERVKTSDAAHQAAMVNGSVCMRKPAYSPASDDSIDCLLANGWQSKSRENGTALYKSFRFRSFELAFAFMTRVAETATALNHHPEWSNVYNRVECHLTTHAMGNTLTDLDVELAQAFDHAEQDIKASTA